MERLDRFMARANAAYYAHRDPYADFTTSPEISQVFGEILGLWAAVAWKSMGRPDPVLLAEAGPGRATLMADALRAIAKQVPDFRAALRLHLIETSPRLRARQAVILPEAVWHEDVADLPAGPLLLIANEFLDALPIRQFVRRGDGWVERFVEAGAYVERPADLPSTEPSLPYAREEQAIQHPIPSPPRKRGSRPAGLPEGAAVDSRLRAYGEIGQFARSARDDFAVVPVRVPEPSLRAEGEAIQGASQGAGLLRSARDDAGAVLAAFLHTPLCGNDGEEGCNVAEGAVVEICEPARGLATLLGRRLVTQGGVALFIDYGPERSASGDSLQAVRDGRPADPLAEPGEADLTAHVDFQAFAQAARSAGAAVYGPLPQGVFLARLGLFQRTDRLARTQPAPRAAALVAAAQRLAEPMHMGRLFKTVAIAQPGLPTPPGFEADA